MAHTILHEWEERDKKARKKKKKGKRKDRKSIEEQMPGEIEAITAGPREEELEMAMAGPSQGPLPRPVPGGSAPGFPTREGQWIPRTAKKGGRVRGYSSGKRVKASGKIRGAGKVKKGVRKAKMVKMKG